MADVPNEIYAELSISHDLDIIEWLALIPEGLREEKIIQTLRLGIAVAQGKEICFPFIPSEDPSRVAYNRVTYFNVVDSQPSTNSRIKKKPTVEEMRRVICLLPLDEDGASPKISFPVYSVNDFTPQDPLVSTNSSLSNINSSGKNLYTKNSYTDNSYTNNSFNPNSTDVPPDLLDKPKFNLSDLESSESDNLLTEDDDSKVDELLNSFNLNF